MDFRFERDALSSSLRSKSYKTTASQSLGVLQGKVALAALKGDQTLADLAQQFDVHVNQIAQWRSQLLEGAAGVFGDEPTPNPSEKADLSRRPQIMRRLDELHLEHPFAGSRMLCAMLQREGVSIGRRHMRTLMKRMGISAIYRRPRTSAPSAGHKIYPYLLRDLAIERPT